MKDKTLIAKDLKKYYGKKHTLVKAVDDLSIELNNGEITLILGPSGSGKTTLLTMIGGLMKPTSGSVFINGENIYRLTPSKLNHIRKESIGFVFQSFNLFSSLSALENVMVPLIIQGMNIHDASHRASSILRKMKLERRKDNKPKDLSGGEKQRIAIARALVSNPHIVLADEPTANLDSENGEEVMEILKDIALQQGKTVVIVSHDQRIMDLAQRKIYIENGKILKEL